MLKDLGGDVNDVVMGSVQRIETAAMRTRRERVLPGVRRRMQVDDYSCCVQCAMSILEFSSHDYTKAQLKKPLRTTKPSGTSDEQTLAFHAQARFGIRRTSRAALTTRLRTAVTGVPVPVGRASSPSPDIACSNVLFPTRAWPETPMLIVSRQKRA